MKDKFLELITIMKQLEIYPLLKTKNILTHYKNGVQFVIIVWESGYIFLPALMYLRICVDLRMFFLVNIEYISDENNNNYKPRVVPIHHYEPNRN